MKTKLFRQLRFWSPFFLGVFTSAQSATIPGETSANPELERDTLARIMQAEELEDPACQQRQIDNRRVISVDANKSIEEWIVDRCGAQVTYTVTYIRAPDGGTLIGLAPPVLPGGQSALEKPLFPQQFADVWIRTGEKVVSLPAFSAFGDLIISEQQVTFGGGEKILEIYVSEINSVTLGKMSGDFFNDWAILRYGTPEKTVGFKDGSSLGWGKRTTMIYKALQSAVKK